MNAPLVSVIVPAYRAEATIMACMASLRGQQGAPSYEVMVVNSSPDATPDLLRDHFPEARLIQLAQQTDPARARNLGAHQGRGTLLAFLDADCIAPPHWLKRLCATLDGYDGAGGAITNANGATLASWAGYFCEFREFLPGDAPRDATNLTLGNAVYRRDAFVELGGFPEGFFPQEDQVFHQALQARGFRLRYDPTITVAHHHRATVAALLAHQRHIGRANARVLAQSTTLPGAWLARRPTLTQLALPALTSLRLARTLYACRHVEHGIICRHPRLAWLCWRGSWQWGLGFAEGCRAQASWPSDRGGQSMPVPPHQHHRPPSSYTTATVEKD